MPLAPRSTEPIYWCLLVRPNSTALGAPLVTGRVSLQRFGGAAAAGVEWMPRTALVLSREGGESYRVTVVAWVRALGPSVTGKADRYRRAGNAEDALLRRRSRAQPSCGCVAGPLRCAARHEKLQRGAAEDD